MPAAQVRGAAAKAASAARAQLYGLTSPPSSPNGPPPVWVRAAKCRTNPRVSGHNFGTMPDRPLPVHPLIVIPARLASTRLPDKPLADIGGRPMIVHVWRRALEAESARCVVAAAEPAIAEAVEARPAATAVLTDPDLPSGSDRVWAAVQSYDPEGRLRCRGQPAGRPADHRSGRDRARCWRRSRDAAVDIAHPGGRDRRRRRARQPERRQGGPRPARPAHASAAPLYFIRATAPSGDGPHCHHIGIYAYRRAALERFVALPPGPLGAAREAGAAARARGRHAHRRGAR